MLELEIQRRIDFFLERLEREYGVNPTEKERIHHAVLSYADGYSDLAMATALVGVLEMSGHIFTEDMSNPIRENEQKASEFAQRLLNEMYGTKSMSASNINASLDEIKRIGIFARQLGIEKALTVVEPKN